MSNIDLAALAKTIEERTTTPVIWLYRNSQFRSRCPNCGRDKFIASKLGARCLECRVTAEQILARPNIESSLQVRA